MSTATYLLQGLGFIGAGPVRGLASWKGIAGFLPQLPASDGSWEEC